MLIKYLSMIYLKYVKVLCEIDQYLSMIYLKYVKLIKYLSMIYFEYVRVLVKRKSSMHCFNVISHINDAIFAD
ncbi:hypothetical protein RchiOBHm_Chr1g0337951 [Rosa chinensis]|uniref:Uncharacterized protein n=1 Tax=Rosa chinensis TaxID=74649 RepID=A0A2P6SD26_ROSCH|nr:hypothetical protein RchiOBHm_Chr1g0337951 [Rosa chinensis]